MGEECESSVAFEGNVEGLKHGGVDDADGWDAFDDEGDGDAEHGEEMGVVYCAWVGEECEIWGHMAWKKKRDDNDKNVGKLILR